MKIGKPLLLIATPIGLAIGLYEGWRLARGLVFVMATFIAFLGFAFLIAFADASRSVAAEVRAAGEDPDRPPDRPG